MPPHKANAIEPIDIARNRQKPQETVGGLGNIGHPGSERAILCPPGGVHVLGDVFVRIEGVKRGCEQQDADKARTERSRNGRAEPFTSNEKPWAKSHLSHLAKSVKHREGGFGGIRENACATLISAVRSCNGTFSSMSTLIVMPIVAADLRPPRASLP